MRTFIHTAILSQNSPWKLKATAVTAWYILRIVFERWYIRVHAVATVARGLGRGETFFIVSKIFCIKFFRVSGVMHEYLV